jgi:hypothetical protein
MSDLNANENPTSLIAQIPMPTRMGNNPIAYAERAYTPDSCLLGNRYLSRKGSMFFIGPSGQGKSTAIMQALICWSCGRAAFEIPAAFPLRILLVQAEDDDDDLTDMARVCDHLELSSEEKQLVRQNAWIETINDQIGEQAMVRIRQMLQEHPCDLLILNPYTAYLNGSIQDDEVNSRFIRSSLQSIANLHNCGLLIVHHTPKTNFRKSTEKWTAMDWIYSGAGAAVLTNWTRAVLAIDPVGESGVYKFIAAKRGARIGWKQKINYFRHDTRPGVLLWSKATEEEINGAAVAGKNAPRTMSSEQVRDIVPVLDGIRKTDLWDKIHATGVSQRNATRVIQIALDDELITEIKTRGPGKANNVKMIFRSTNAPVLFSPSENGTDP